MSVGLNNGRTPAASTKKTKRITPKLILLVIEERGRCWPGKLQTPSRTDSIPFPDASHSLSDGGQSKPNNPTPNVIVETARKINQNSRQTSSKLGFLDDRHHSIRRIQSWPGHLLNGAFPHSRCSFGEALVRL
jgi:hypothetical protein